MRIPHGRLPDKENGAAENRAFIVLNGGAEGNPSGYNAGEVNGGPTMIARKVRISILKLYVLALGLALVGFGPMVQSPHLYRAYGAHAVWSGPVRWYEYVVPAILTGMALASVATFAWAVVVTVRPSWHLTYRRLAAFGPPYEVAAAIDKELADKGEVVQIGRALRAFRLSNDLHQPTFVTRSWALQFTDFRLHVVRLEDVVWVRKALFWSATADSGASWRANYFVEVKVRKGSTVYFGGREADVDRLLFELISRQPWVLSGANERWDELWRIDQGQVFERVEAQREQVQAQRPEERRASLEEKVSRARTEAIERKGRPPREGR